MNWNLFADFQLSDLRLLREPVFWASVLASVAYIIFDVVAGSLGWQDAIVPAVNIFLGLLVRGQVTAPVPPRR